MDIKLIIELRNLYRAYLDILLKEGTLEDYSIKGYVVYFREAIFYLNDVVSGKVQLTKEDIGIIKKRYSGLYHPHGGLGEFYIHRENAKERVFENEIVSQLQFKINNIFEILLDQK